MSSPPWGPLEALTNVFGRQIQFLNGYPTTRVNVDFGVADTTLDVETTLGFPSSGQIWIAGMLHDYTGVTAVTFTGVTTASGETRQYIYGVRTEVSLHIPSAPPE